MSYIKLNGKEFDADVAISSYEISTYLMVKIPAES